ncbi:MAG: AsnC family transcriptional regulator [Planctomycetota bacterium]
MDDTDRRILEALQDGLPLVPQPFAEAARQVGIGEAEVLERLQGMVDRWEVRRVAASIAHRRAGVTANVMCAWRVPAEAVEAFAAEATRCEAITHLYDRETSPDWPYNVYAMIHGRELADCQAVIADLVTRTGQEDYVALLSTREFKKTWTRL